MSGREWDIVFHDGRHIGLRADKLRTSNFGPYQFFIGRALVAQFSRMDVAFIHRADLVGPQSFSPGVDVPPRPGRTTNGGAQ